jgi:hypothetical protein
LITIINYDLYQGDGTTYSTTDGTTDSTTDGTHLNNVNNVKNVKNKDMVAKRRQIPPDFILSDKLLQFAKTHGINGTRIQDVFAHFCEYHQSRGTVMLDWDKAFMTWVRNDEKFRGGNDAKFSGRQGKGARANGSLPAPEGKYIGIGVELSTE